MIPRPQQGAGLLVLALALSLVVAVVREGVDALVAAGVAVGVVDDHVVRGDGQVDAQLVAGQAALGLRGQRSRWQVSSHFITSVIYKRCSYTLYKVTFKHFWSTSQLLCYFFSTIKEMLEQHC